MKPFSNDDPAPHCVRLGLASGVVAVEWSRYTDFILSMAITSEILLQSMVRFFLILRMTSKGSWFDC